MQIMAQMLHPAFSHHELYPVLTQTFINKIDGKDRKLKIW